MKEVVIMRGIPGAGKGHYVKALIADSNLPDGRSHQLTVCSADHFFGLDYNFDPTKLPEAHASCMSAFLQAILEEHEMVVVDNTNIKQWMYEAYEKVARLAGYNVEIVEVMPETIEELRKCAERNTHRVPVDVVARMAMEFEPFSGARREKARF
jgi:predicted kinase